jgi:Tfp pilus assembly protein PilE
MFQLNKIEGGCNMNKKGFTLIELLSIIAVITLPSSFVSPD